jgi:arylmalonate decarboxylase
MTRHFGVLIPSTNTTVEIECRLLPATYQAHIGRLGSSGGGSFSPSRDEDIDYQSRLLGTARVEMVILAQTSASLFADDYDDVVTRRMSAGSGVPAITSAQAVGRAVRALGARRIAIVSPYSEAVNERAARYFEARHGLRAIALEGFGATDAYAIGRLGPENARGAFARINRPEIEAFVVPGGNFPTMASVAAWEREFGKPVVTTNQASFWAMLRAFDSADRLAALGRLLAELPADPAQAAGAGSPGARAPEQAALTSASAGPPPAAPTTGRG